MTTSSKSNQTNKAGAQDKLVSHHFCAVLRTSDGVESWSAEQLLTALHACVRGAELNGVADVSASFQPQGASAVVVLEESHVAVHLWPERGLATIDIHVCDYSGNNELKAQRLARLLGEKLNGSDSLDKWSKLTVSE